MGRLIPIFTDTGRGRHFEGQFRDEESGRVGHLEVPPLSPTEIGTALAAATIFVSDRGDKE